MQKTLDELAEIVNGAVVGNGALVISDVTKIEEGTPGKISFLANPRYEKCLEDTKASAVIVPRNISKARTNLLQVDDPYLAFREIIKLFYPFPEVSGHFIHPTAYIDKNAHLEQPVHIGAFVYVAEEAHICKHTRIGAHSYIGKNTSIGENVNVHPHATILKRCKIGNRAIIHAGTVIGSDGFGYARENEKYLKIPQVGNVVIGDDVEIGANCTIDRATLGSTRIGAGCKIDNLVQIAHNVVIGENTAIAAQSGISGSTKVGARVTMGGQVGIVGHIEIGENTILGAKSGVTKSVPKNSFYFGFPARDHRQLKKIEVMMRKLPEMYERLRSIEMTLNNRIKKHKKTQS